MECRGGGGDGGLSQQNDCLIQKDKFPKVALNQIRTNNNNSSSSSSSSSSSGGSIGSSSIVSPTSQIPTIFGGVRRIHSNSSLDNHIHIRQP